MQLVAQKAFSLEPNKLALYTKFDWVAPLPDQVKKSYRPTLANPVKRQFHNFEISENAYRNLRRKINWLYTLSKKRDIKTWAGKNIFAFRCSFLTFTLPSKQVHPTAYITSEMFNNLLTQLRKKFGMENYVWRLEFQANGNVHYHLVTDSFIEWRTMRAIWNGICELHGYIEPYRAKHQKMSLADYVKAYNGGGTRNFSDLKKAYIKGKQEKWGNPNSVDAKSVVSKKAIAAYVSKYFGKPAKTGKKCNALDTPENSKGLRLWYCSQSLSRLKNISDYLAHVPYQIEDVVRCIDGFRRVVTKYCTLYFFDLTKATGWVQKFVRGLYLENSSLCGYCPA